MHIASPSSGPGKRRWASRRRLLRLLIGGALLVTAASLPLADPGGGLRHALPLGGVQPALARPGKGLPKNSKYYRSTRKALPKSFVEFETRRFVLFSDANSNFTRSQSELLERTTHQFERYMRRLGIKPADQRHKLVCVLFESHADYQEFARTEDEVTAAWISGYYSPKHDRVVFYDIEANAEYGHIDRWGRAAREALASHHAKAAIATTIHEAVHQLVFHTGIQSARIQNPLWISEGLATAFETDRPQEAFGPDHDYPVRIEELQRLIELNLLIPMQDLVQYSAMPGDDDDTIAAVYHQSYAMVTWLNRYRRRQLREYLLTLRDEPSGRPTGERHLDIFESVFGDVGLIENKWLAFENDRLGSTRFAGVE